MKFLLRVFDSRFFALALKEIRQILSNKQLIFLLLFPPTMQLLLYGFALNPDVTHIKLGVVDYANVTVSQELVSALTENRVFVREQFLLDDEVLAQQVREGKLTAGLVIPPEFNRDLARDKTAEVQVFIDGVDANTAGIAQGYITRILSRFSRTLEDASPPLLVSPHVTFLYNPGLISSWFFVPGMLGVVLTLISTLVSSVALVQEKDTGTLEQLLMTPAGAWEILMAKIVPLFLLLMGDVCIGLSVARLIFNVPFRGSILLFFFLSGISVFVGIGIGLMLATLCRTQQQVVLTTFFINLPLVQLSGAIAPIESMPEFFQYFSLLNPLRHFVAITRGILLKGVGMEVLWPNALALAAFSFSLLAISANRFRSQIS